MGWCAGHGREAQVRRSNTPANGTQGKVVVAVDSALHALLADPDRVELKRLLRFAVDACGVMEPDIHQLCEPRRTSIDTLCWSCGERAWVRLDGIRSCTQSAADPPAGRGPACRVCGAHHPDRWSGEVLLRRPLVVRVHPCTRRIVEGPSRAGSSARSSTRPRRCRTGRAPVDRRDVGRGRGMTGGQVEALADTVAGGWMP
jgi:hypothetical protein